MGPDGNGRPTWRDLINAVNRLEERLTSAVGALSADVRGLDNRIRSVERHVAASQALSRFRRWLPSVVIGVVSMCIALAAFLRAG